MADLILTTMIPPAFDVTYNTIDGTPYRAPASVGSVDVQPQHVAELTARFGFTTPIESQLPAGDDTSVDVGWAVAQ